MNLPRKIFEHQDAVQQVVDEGLTFHLIEKVTFEGGIKTYILGAEYPQKGFAPAEIIVAINNAKKTFIQMVLMLFKPYMIISLLTISIWNKKKIIQDFAFRFMQLNIRSVKPYFLKDEYLTPFAREIKIVVTNFLIQAGLKEGWSIIVGKIISTIFEFDNAYRYMAQDLFTATDKMSLVNKPIREIYRIGKLGRERCGNPKAKYLQNRVGWNIYFISILLGIALLYPSIRKCFKFAFLYSDFEKLQFDKIDEYWVAQRTDYDYFGEDNQTRIKRVDGMKIPRPVPLEVMERIRKGEKVDLKDI